MDAGLIRRTTVELGPLRITREYRVAALHPDYPFADLPVPARARLGGWRSTAVLGVIGMVGAGGLAVAATKAPPPRASYSVSVAVPERPVASAAPRAEKRAVTPRAVATPVPQPEETAAPEQMAADIGSRAAAIAAALRSGEVQEWYEADRGVRGFVVAGVAEQDGDRTCRDLSVLTRAPGAADRVDQRRDCVTVVAG